MICIWEATNISTVSLNRQNKVFAGISISFFCIQIWINNSLLDFNKSNIAPIRKVTKENMRPLKNQIISIFRLCNKKNTLRWNLSPPRVTFVVTILKWIKNVPVTLCFTDSCGDGGNRTRVRRSEHWSFYILSLLINLIRACSTNKTCPNQPEESHVRPSDKAKHVPA